MSSDEREYLLNIIVTKKVNMLLLYYSTSAQEYNEVAHSKERELTTNEFIKIRKLMRP